MEDQQEAYARLITHLRETIPFSDQEMELIIPKFTPRKLKRKEILLFKGEVSSHMTFVAQGCLRTYYIDPEGQEHITQFSIENWWANDFSSYLTKSPATHFVQAVEESVVLQIHRSALKELIREVPRLERFFNIKVQRAYVALQERNLNSMAQTAEERYLAFCRRYRNIEQRVPQYMVASYLGITPEFLSNIRKKLLHSA